MSGGPDASRIYRTAGALSVVVVLGAGTVVARETYLEYQTWQDRPLGLLDVLWGVAWHDLPAAPRWGCAAASLVEGPGRELTVQPVVLGTRAVDEASWRVELGKRLPFSFDVRPSLQVPDLDAAWRYSQAHPGIVVIALTHTYYRGPVLNERLAGWSCSNLAMVNERIDCPQRIAAHEVGHVLGLDHTPTGLMRPKAIACGDRLVAQQVQWLEVRYPLLPLPVKPLTAPEPAGSLSVQNDTVMAAS